jgi:pyruvate/2-oxoglutarate dehydrogenase complex dihydrolipoamide acyltransferase (E2) component
MVTDVLVPQMGESVLEGTILDWKVKIGDKIEINQPLVELMTDKVNVEIPAEASGILTAQFVKVGEVVPVGTRIATIDDGKGTGVSAGKSDAKPAVAAKAAPVAGSMVAAPILMPEVKGTAPAGNGKMSPKVRTLIREYGVDPSAVVPTGKDGLVTVEDVMRTVEARSAASGLTTGPIPAPPQPIYAASATGAPVVFAAPSASAAPKVKVQIPVFAPLPADQKETRMPLVGARKLIAEHMVKSKQTSPHVTTFEDIDLTELVAFRERIKGDFRATYGANLTYIPFVIKAACVGLRKFPTINASLTEKEIILKNYINIGVAVAREEGLIVPVIKNADRKTIIEIAVEIAQLGEKARTNRLMPDDVSDGTFTLTNAGMFGATASTPIINQPQVAILGIHQIVKRPWVVNNQIVIRDISSFGMSFDHRLIDGHTAVQFLHLVHEFLADPSRLLLQLR